MSECEQRMEESTTVERPRPGRRRRWLTYSLRTLLFLMLLTCLASAWFTKERRSARAQLDAVGRIREMDGKVYYDYQRTAGGGWDLKAPHPSPAWLVDLVGTEFGRRVVWVNLAATKVTDKELVCLESLTSTEFLLLQYGAVTDDGLLHVSRLTRLKHLHLNSNGITSKGLAHLAALTKLETLDLSSTSIGDGSLLHLEQLTNLRTLYLRDTSLSEQALAELKRSLPKCEIYRINEPAVLANSESSE